MNALALDMSSFEGRLAAVSDTEFAVEEGIPLVRRGGVRRIPDAMERMLQQVGWTWDDVDLYVAGRGPGQYSGLRAALTTVRALALPDGRPVRALSSGWGLLGAALLKRPGARHVLIAGDARRERMWLGRFDYDGTTWIQSVEWQLATVDEWAARSAGDVLCVSSEWTRLASVLATASAPERDWLREDLAPSAIALGRQALALERADAAREEPLPIYLHPAVALPGPRR